MCSCGRGQFGSHAKVDLARASRKSDRRVKVPDSDASKLPVDKLNDDHLPNKLLAQYRRHFHPDILSRQFTRLGT